jgi:hypothetical protein
VYNLYPKTIRVDQGPEFVSRDVDIWLATWRDRQQDADIALEWPIGAAPALSLAPEIPALASLVS